MEPAPSFFNWHLSLSNLLTFDKSLPSAHTHNPHTFLHTPFIPVPCAPRLTTLRLGAEATAEAGTSAAGLGQAPASVNKRRGFSRAPNPGAAEAQAGGAERVGTGVGSHSDGSQPAGIQNNKRKIVRLKLRGCGGSRQATWSVLALALGVTLTARNLQGYSLIRERL